MKSLIPIIFTHFGITDYLSFALKQAKRSNPHKRCILIGDVTNKGLAQKCGWEHIDFRNLQSTKRKDFNSYFRWVQGRLHNPIRGGQDWLRYVSERFFAIEILALEQNIEYFWHFDTDTMIMDDLSTYEQKILNLGIRCTTLCNNSCPSGLIETVLISEFCESMLKIYQDKQYLLAQQQEFDTINPRFALTEMRAFQKFKKENEIHCAFLGNLFIQNNIMFDNCICGHDNVAIRWADRPGRLIKNLYHDCTDVRVDCIDGSSLRLATINCSWVSIETFQWIECVSLHVCVPRYLCDYLALPLYKSLLGRIASITKSFLLQLISSSRMRFINFS